MEEIKKYIFDIECDELLDKVTKIHCLSYCDVNNGLVCSTTYQEQIKDFFLQENVVLIGHNIISYDIPVVEKLLNIKVNSRLIDTLSLSWTLFPERDKPGLASWGEYFGIAKPEITDYAGQDIKDIIHRCEEDVKINLKVWNKIRNQLNQLYDNSEDIHRYIDYLTFKLKCLQEQQNTGIKLNIPLIEQSLKELEQLKEEKVNTLKAGMPKKPVKSVKFPPKVMYKANREPSSNRLKWLEFLKSYNLPEDHNIEVEFISDYEEPNPNSHDQIKEWLYSLGWIPENIKHFRDKKKNEVRQIPQLKSKTEEGEICNSIKKLFPLAPALEALDDLFIISHRISVFKGFLRDNVNGRLYQGASSFTNTLRLQHTGIVNLPNVFKPFSENIRKSLITDNHNTCLVGCDLSGIEDNTKRHYIYQYDPQYVEDMKIEGYDPHLELAILAGFLTKEQAEAHKAGTENYKEIRQKAKTANFALTYKTGVATLARSTGLSEKEAKKLKNVYWERNNAILKVEEALKIKTINGQMWLLNPVSKFWYSLRAEKDKFSTLNQGTAVYVFDIWLKYIRQKGIQIAFQIHDEWTANIWHIDKEETTEYIKQSIQQTNEELKLNVQVDCSIAFGNDYISVH